VFQYLAFYMQKKLSDFPQPHLLFLFLNFSTISQNTGLWFHITQKENTTEHRQVINTSTPS
ncbi:hypothetical protein PVN23_21895, partial [Bacillus licheniformis]|uniref:hypothetical protein n=1 Tax=Bacillus licheniformis TaxID=1402 RepID=UPI00237D0D93